MLDVEDRKILNQNANSWNRCVIRILKVYVIAIVDYSTPISQKHKEFREGR